MLDDTQFKKELIRAMKSRPTMEHPILMEFLAPRRNMRLARLFAGQVYQLTAMFERYIAALFYRCPVREFRSRLIENLYEEVTGKLSNTDGHLELMERFILALGFTREELDAAEPLPETRELIDFRRRLVDDPASYHKAAAAIMIASEGQTIQKKEGMPAYEYFAKAYNLTQDDLLFFSVHAAEDVHHVIEGVELVTAVCKDEKMQQEAIATVRETVDRFWGFYEGIQRAYQAESAAN
jgi:pyrroloquinoline-quinone synthase